MIFHPTYFTPKVTDITAEFLQKAGIKTIILDIDDTLVPHKMPNPQNNIVEWVNNIKLKNIKIILVSNNFKNRVKLFAHKLNLPYIYMSMKPFTLGLARAMRKTCSLKKNTLLIGDQIFTDICAANFMGIRSVLVNPVSKSKTSMLKIKRALENPLRKKIQSSANLNLENLEKSSLEHPATKG